MQSGPRGDSNTAWVKAKTRSRGARTYLCAFKWATLVENLAPGAHLSPKPSLVSSHPVKPSTLEMPTKAQSDVRGGSNSLWGVLITQAGGARTTRGAL